MDEKLERVYTHWLEMSDKDFETMRHLHQSGDMHWALFMGHLVLEKLLKACVVKKTNNIAPLTHDLSRLAGITTFRFSEEQLDWLDAITTFNINARYDDYKQAFYKKCTPEFTSHWLEKIKTLQQWIKEKLRA
jgi:HEPN domain-containing protein